MEHCFYIWFGAPNWLLDMGGQMGHLGLLVLLLFLPWNQ